MSDSKTQRLTDAELEILRGTYGADKGARSHTIIAKMSLNAVIELQERRALDVSPTLPCPDCNDTKLVSRGEGAIPLSCMTCATPEIK